MSDARQLLGMKGASGTTNIWKLRLQLMKPVTWIPLIWGVICGAAASGQYEWKLDHLLAAVEFGVLPAHDARIAPGLPPEGPHGILGE